MPKKSTRGGAQRNRAKVQKNVSLVRPNAGVVTEEPGTPEEVEVEETQAAVEDGIEESNATAETVATTATATATATTATASAVSTGTTGSRGRSRRATRSGAASAPVIEEKESEGAVTETAPKGSASARLAARRQSAQKSQQRVAPTLITAEHYAYVRKDLVYIAILAILMFATIIILHFVPGIGL
jgi:hypothetical protein